MSTQIKREWARGESMQSTYNAAMRKLEPAASPAYRRIHSAQVARLAMAYKDARRDMRQAGLL
jgi:hypothetical protein